MPDMDKDIERLAPQKLLERFSRGRILLCLGAAALLHVVIIASLSTNYIYYSWINPEAGRAREEAAKKAAEGSSEEAASPAPAAAADTNQVAETKPRDGDSGKTQEQLLEEHKDAPVVKAITEKATPEEIPDEPDSLGISIEDTNL